MMLILMIYKIHHEIWRRSEIKAAGKLIEKYSKRISIPLPIFRNVNISPLSFILSCCIRHNIVRFLKSGLTACETEL